MQTSIQCNSGITGTALLLFYEALNDGTGFRATLSGDARGIVTREAHDPAEFADSSEFRDHYWAVESFSKLPFDIGVDREAAAMEKFRQSEEQCARANSEIVEWESRPNLPKELRRARALVHSVLGDFPLDEIWANASFGPGATTQFSRARAQQPNKWAFGTHITESALPYFLAFRRFASGWDGGAQKLEIVAGNKVTTVPKNAKTDRVIAIEPDWNMFFQRAVGVALRRRLQKRCSLLFPDAQTRNNVLAREGSLTGAYATIDLSNASDTVSLALCEALLPPSWLSVLLDLRSPCGLIGDVPITYEKVSSMGNGFTFELETLFFWAIARACCKDGIVTAYGDDIIVPGEFAPRVLEVLQGLGFSVNSKKTFVTGPFRESCGGHYWGGCDVTPPYFKKPFAGYEVVKATNRLRHCTSERYGYWLDGRFRDMWQYLASQAPRDTFKGPAVLGDAVLHTSWTEARPKWNPHYQRWQVKGRLPRAKAVASHQAGGMWASLWGPSVTEWSDRAHAELGYRVGKLLCDRWDGPAPWLEAQFV